MDRKGPRGSKPKNVPPKDLFALGNKSSNSSNITRVSGNNVSSGNDSQQSSIGHDKVGHSSGYSKASGTGSDRGRDSSAGFISKKSTKPSFHGARVVARPSNQKTVAGDVEGWETSAEVVEIDELLPLLEAAEEREDFDRIETILCGTVKTLKLQRIKPDNILCMTLMYIAKIKPALFHSSPVIIDAFCSLLKKSEVSLSFKAKNNASVSVLVANLLLSIFQEEKCWPETFVRVFIEDSLGDRLWVDHEDCRGFVDNLIASFKTKMPPKTLLFPDLGLATRPDCPSPPVSTCSGVESGDGDSEISLECRESLDVNITNRYVHMISEIEEIVVDAIQNHLNLRHQNVDAVARNFIRFLSTICGFQDVRKVIAPRLETWLQNPKLQRPAIELLMSLCLNCNTHSVIDQKVIGYIVHIRLKVKPLTNHYMACLRELLTAHPDNIAAVIKETTFNELSPSRNLTNMAILSVVFQYSPEHSAIILAEIFLELLRSSEDFLRALRALLREIVRSLRYDMQYQKFCHGLMKEQKDANFKENFEYKERMFHGIVDLIVFTIFISISPQVRDGAIQIHKGEMKEVEIVKRYQESVSSIQQDTMYWMHRIVPKTYTPTKEECAKNLQKLLIMDQPEFYYQKDNMPAEGDRPLYFRLASEVPLKQETLQRLLIIGSMKEQYMKPQEILELADKLIKRATSSAEMSVEMLRITDTKIIELIFNLCPYIPPENSPLPINYRSPKTAIANLYWKAWLMLLLITAHNPNIFGVLAWESYPILRVMMEMCITNSFTFPPPTLSIGDKGDEMNNQELLLCSRERQQILEFESHLAQKTITEQNSLLLSQLISMDTTGPARKPPAVVLEQLKTLNLSHKIGQLLCRCRKPDFLVDIIQRQGALQSMPWLAQLVESNDDAFSVLPVQCLCEYLLSETVVTTEGIVTTHHQQLLQHLRCLLLSPRQGEDHSTEILEYFLRRLSSQQPSARVQAVRGLQLVVGPLTVSMEVEPDKQEPYRWLLKHLVSLPGFHKVRTGACQALRAACLIETKPAAVSAYIRFLAVHTYEDSLQEMAALVQDMAQLIVERSTMISAILPSPELQCGPHKFPHAPATLNSLFIIFINYMHGVKLPSSDIYPWSENPDNVRVQWASDEQAVLHILVIHAMVILLIYGPCASSDLFHELLNIWFPLSQEMPQAFLVETSQEALLLPDWLKLKMIRSTVPQLVDAALKDLEPSQLVLFIQSFGIPVASMTKLLCALDLAVSTSEEAVAAAVLDKSHKSYMAQLVEVQHQRGAHGGHSFATTLGDRDDDVPSENPAPFKPIVTAIKPIGVLPMDLSISEVQSFILQCYTSTALHVEHKKQVKDTMRSLQQHLCNEMSSLSHEKPYLNELLRSVASILQSSHREQFVRSLHHQNGLSAPLFRLLLSMKDKLECSHFFSLMVQVVAAIVHVTAETNSFLSRIFAYFTPTMAGSTVSFASNSKCRAQHQLTYINISSEENILLKLNDSTGSQLERVIRDIVQIAMNEGKISLVVNVIANLLISKLKNQRLSGMPDKHIALLLDWLHILDPELSFMPASSGLILLFGKSKYDKGLVVIPPLATSSGKSSAMTSQMKSVYSQVYLLAAYTHQANWASLENTIHEILKNVESDLDPTAVLDFVWAVLHVPKLWQGRERRSPRHARPDLPLKLTSSEILSLTQYVLLESKLNSEDGAAWPMHRRISLLFLCLEETAPASVMQSLVQHLALKITSRQDDRECGASSEILYNLYLRRPNIILNISNEVICSLLQIQLKRDIEEPSSADVSLHTLLTMLTAPIPGKDFIRRMQDLEAAVRKLTSKHPLLVIRHLPLIASALQGLTHLHLSVFHSKNYPELFSMILGILELEQPLIFHKKYEDTFCKIIDAYIALFKEYGRMRDLSSLLLRTCHLLMAWVGVRGSSVVSLYIVKHSELFTMLLRSHPDMLPLRSLTALAASKGIDHPKSDKKFLKDVTSHFQGDFGDNLETFQLPIWMQQQVREVLSQLENSNTSEEEAELLKRVKEISDASMGLALPPFLHSLAEGLLSLEAEKRDKSWNLLIQLLRKMPKMAPQTAIAVLAALNSEELSVGTTAVEHLPEVILLLHEFAPDLLSSGFLVCLFADASATDMLSEALFLLTIHSGA